MNEQAKNLANRLAAQLGGDWVKEFPILVEDHIGGSSPIEELMGAAILYLLNSEEHFGNNDCNVFEISGLQYGFNDIANPKESGFTIIPEFTMGRYRSDFFIYYHGPAEDCVSAGIIECDGHDFHEKTKEQVRRDKERDRNLQGAGLTVLRYAGSEIVADPVACAFSALKTFEHLAKLRQHVHGDRL